MNYKKIYNQLIKKAKNRNLKKLKKSDLNYIYLETHHIIPKSLGGTNENYNLVNLTAREHYIAHCLLYMIYKYSNNKDAYIKMTYALCRLMTGNAEFIEDILKQHYNSRLYENIASHREISEQTKIKIGNANRGRHPSEETRKKLSISSKQYCKEHINGFYGKHHTEETKKKISRPGKLSAWYGRHHTEETKKKLSESRKNNPKCHGKNIGRKPGFHFSLETKIKQFHIAHDKQYPNADWSQFNYEEYYSIKNEQLFIQKKLRKQYIIDYLKTYSI